MNVHNIMEEKVFNHVNDLYNQMKEQNVSWLSCDCEQCRLDTASYVLNRIPPRYVVSGRGVSHNASLDDTQLRADINALVMEGKQTIVALGAGASTKAVYPDGRIERCENVKDVNNYIARIDEMIERKRSFFKDFDF